MVLVHHHADGGEASDGEKAPVAFFHAPTPVQTISFSGDKIAPMKGTDTNDLIAFLLDGITLILI